jgi:hypothetical protein
MCALHALHSADRCNCCRNYATSTQHHRTQTTLQDNNLQEFLARVGGGDAEDDDQFSQEASNTAVKRQRQHSIEDAGEEDQLMSAMGVLVVCRYEKLPIEQQSVLR